MFGVCGSWIGLFLNILCLVAQFYVALYPIDSSPNVENFFQAYLAAPLVIIFFLGYKITYRQWYIGVKVSEMNIDEGRRETDIDDFGMEIDAERAQKAVWPWYKRCWDFLM